jgi:glycosyltransferase involved in cell wall biosynthesis
MYSNKEKIDLPPQIASYSKESKVIVIFCHYAQQPPFNTMLRYHNWGKQLVKLGFKVLIVSSSTVHNTNIDLIHELGQNFSQFEGVDYYYIKTNKYIGNGLGRFFNMQIYRMGIKSIKKFKINPYKVIISGAYLYNYVKSIFYKSHIITDIVDLWPESIVQYGKFSKSNPLILYLYNLERIALRKSNAIIFSMEGGIDYINTKKYIGINTTKIFHINMGINLLETQFNKRNYQIKIDWPKNQNNFIYCGSIRTANQVSQIIHGANELLKRKVRNIFFHIYGNGEELESLKQYCKDNDIFIVKFYGRVEKKLLPFLLSNGDLNIMTYEQVPLMVYGGSQSKLFDYLSSGKPILSTAKFGYSLIERYKCGIVTKDQTPSAFADAIEYFLSLSTEEKTIMEENAINVLKFYDENATNKRLMEVFEFIDKHQKVV